MEKIRIGILGTGDMAHRHAQCLRSLGERCEVVAGCDVDEGRLHHFARENQIPETYNSLDDMLEHARLDGVINVTPDSLHAGLTFPIIEKGVAVFCEKPLALSYEDAARMRDAAEQAGVVNMVNFIYRNMPAIQTAREIVTSGTIGEPRHVEASYLQSWLTGNHWGVWWETPRWLWRLSTGHGSGGVLIDVGVHILDFASFPVGSFSTVQCRLKTFPKAENDQIGEYRLDANDSAAIIAEFENGALGVIHASRWATGYKNCLKLQIHGEKGAIRIDLDRAEGKLELCEGEGIHTQDWHEIECEPRPDIWERFIHALETGENGEPDFARGAEIQKVLDACFESNVEEKPVRID